MPYASERQSRFIHAKANEGVPWAQKFVSDAHGSQVPGTAHGKGKRKMKAKRKKKKAGY